MEHLEMNTSAFSTFVKRLQSLWVGSCRFVGLKEKSTSISTGCWRQQKWTMLSLVIQTRYTSLLIDWYKVCLKRESILGAMILSGLSTSWTVLLKRRLNLLLIRVIKNLLTT